jgi:hypothetical protein
MLYKFSCSCGADRVMVWSWQNTCIDWFKGVIVLCMLVFEVTKFLYSQLRNHIRINGRIEVLRTKKIR